jgi:hypothetical protein
MSSARWRPAVAAMVTAVLAVSLAACGHAVAPGAGGAPSSPAATTASPAPARAPAPAPSPAQPAPPRASEADQLAGFFAAAVVADGQLRHAAALVNEGVGAKSLNFSSEALAAVKALDVSPATRAIPAGLPPELLRRTLLVYSDLVSRHLALDRVGMYSADYPLSRSSQDGTYVYRCLGNGGPAAARFGADLAAARALAGETPPVTPPAPDSRQAAELALRVYQVEHRNSGCMECGGYVFTALSPIVWQPENEPGIGHSDGYINGVRFRADYHAGQGWSVMTWAC